MSWSIHEVTKLAGVTARTLRHYDEIGLLTPAYVGENGHRHYEEEQLLRLQQILLFRELGLGLSSIGEILDSAGDAASVLRRHHRWLLDERARLTRLAGTVQRTITQLKGGGPVRPEDLFDGFDADKQARYETEMIERYGEGVREHIDEGYRKMQDMTREEAARMQAEYADTINSLVELVGAGAPVDDPRTMEAVDGHCAWLRRSWTPNRESYKGLGELYHDHPDFRAQFDALHPGLAAYLRDAMAAYANARLS